MKRQCVAMVALVAVFAAMGDGAVQTGATMTFSGRSFIVKDASGNEHTYAAGESLCPTQEPAVFYIKPLLSEGEHLWGLTGGDNYGSNGLYYRQPLADGWIPFAPFASAESNMTVSVQLATGVWYVDAEHGNDDWDGTADYEHRDESVGKGPKQSLQAAHDAVSGSKPLVYVAPGVYSNGVSTVTSGAYTCRRRLYVTKMIGFRSTHGAEKTFIVGAPDPETANGLGENAIGGVHLQSGSPHWGPEFLQGFTITGCYSPSSEANYNQYGAACVGGSGRVWFHDCIISNNFGYLGIVAYAQYSRCRVIDNTSYKFTAGAYGASFSCVFAGNSITYADSSTTGASAFSSSHNLYGCTIDQRSPINPDGRLRFMNLLSSTPASAYDCIVLGYRGAETDCFVDTLTAGDMLVADASAYDFRLGALSPAVGAVAYADMRDFARRFASFDVDGRPLAVKDGMATLGAVQNDPPLPCLVILGNGSETVSGGYSLGTNIVTGAGGEVTLTASASRPFAGFEVDGEMAPYAGMSYSFTPSAVDGSVTTVKAVYDTNWYVDCVNGDDANPGTASLPKQTIRAATTNAVAGDVIHVAPGTYVTLEGTQTATSKIAARVVVPADVTLESTGGATNTFIVGAAATGDQIDNATYGTGTNGVRCVYAKSGAVVRGFTLTGGRGVGSGDYSNNGLGAAFLSATARTATLEDCIVSNNASYRGPIYQAVVKRCHILANIGTRTGNASGPAGSTCSYYNCIIDKNIGDATVQSAYALENCTIGASNLARDGKSLNPQVLWWYAQNSAIKNSAILYGRVYGGYNSKIYTTNCVIASTDSIWKTVIPEERRHNTIFTNSTGAKVDSEYRPKLGEFVGIDAGDASVSSVEVGDTDFHGTPRVLNAQIDIGAVEYDWRPTFAERVGKHLTFTDVSPSVTTNAAGGVKIPSGALAGTVAVDGMYSFTFEISGGTLEAFLGGESAGVYPAAVGEQTITLKIPDTTMEFRFVFTPDEETPGAAVLKKIASNRGFVITYR